MKIYDIIASHKGTEGDKRQAAFVWLKENKLNFEELKELLSLFENEENKTSLTWGWLGKPENKLDFASLESLLISFEDKNHKESLVDRWLKNPENKLDFASLTKILPFISSQIAKIALAVQWLEKPENQLDFASLESLLISFEDKNHKESLVKAWLGKPENTLKLDFASLIKILPLLSSEVDKELLATKWLENPENKLDFASLKDLLSLFEHQKSKGSLVWIWLEKPENKLDFEVLKKEVLTLVEEENHKIILALKWLRNPEYKLEFSELKELLSLFESGINKKLLAEEWLENQNKLDFANLKDLLSLFEDDTKLSLALAWFRKEENNTCENLKILISEGFIDTYDYKGIALLCSDFKGRELVHVCHELFPNAQILQIDLFSEFIGKGLITKENLDLIKNFIGEIKDFGDILEFIKLISKKLDLNKIEVLTICSGVVPRQYKSIADSLNNKKLFEYLTPKSAADLGESLGLQIDSITLEALFSYHLITGTVPDFVSSIKPDKLAELRSEFKLPEKQFYFSEEELTHLKAFLGIEFPDLVSTKVLCDYLEKVTQPIKQYTASEISDYKIKFPEDFIHTDKEKESLNLELRELFKSENPDAKAISEFLVRVTGYRAKDSKDSIKIKIDDDDAKKIKDVFMAQKNEFATLLQHPDGIENIAVLFFGDKATKEGCSANIGTKFEMLMKGIRISDPIDRILYSFFTDKFVQPIFGRLGDDLLGASGGGANIYNNRAITTTFLSITALAEELKKEFQHPDEGEIMMWQAIDKESDKIGKSDQEKLEIKQRLMGDAFSPEEIATVKSDLVNLTVGLILSRVLGKNMIPSGHPHANVFKLSGLSGVSTGLVVH